MVFWHFDCVQKVSWNPATLSRENAPLESLLKNVFRFENCAPRIASNLFFEIGLAYRAPGSNM